MHKVRGFLSRFTKLQIGVIIAVAACVIAGGVLLYREWDARRPMDFTLTEPVPVMEMPDAIETSTDTATILSVPTAIPPATPTDTEFTPAIAANAETNTAPAPAQQSSGKPLSLKADEIGRVIIESRKIAIKRGVDEVTLKKHVGWMETSVMPGESGVCVLMGHRDQDLKQLKKVKIGSVITVETPEGSFAYTVYAMDILDKGKSAQIPATEGKELMFLTCYPFYFSGSAPQQLIVRAKMLAL